MLLLATSCKQSPTDPQHEGRSKPFWQKTKLGKSASLKVDHYADSPTIDAVYALGSDGIYRSTDNGDTWTQISATLPISSGYVNDFLVSSTYLYAVMTPYPAGTDPNRGFVFRTPKASDNWRKVDAGFPYSFTGEPLIFQSNVIIETSFHKLVGGMYVNLQDQSDNGIWSSQTGDQWRSTNLKVTAWCLDASTVGATYGLVYVGTSNGVYRSLDNGSLSWSEAGLQGKGIYQIALNVSGSTAGYVFARGSAGLYRSSDEGRNWRLLGVQVGDAASLFTPLEGVVFVGTDTSGVLLSRDNGQTWAPMNDGIERVNGKYPRMLSFAQQGPARYLYVGGGGNVYRSSDPFK